MYRLRAAGEKLSVEQVRRGGVPGRLVYGQHPLHPTMRASICDAVSGDMFDCIDHAQIRKINGGLLIAGFDSRLDRLAVRQAWWCVPSPDAAPTQVP